VSKKGGAWKDKREIIRVPLKGEGHKHFYGGGQQLEGRLKPKKKRFPHSWGPSKVKRGFPMQLRSETNKKKKKGAKRERSG